MLKNDPTNEKLMLSLATKSLKSGRKDLATKLLSLLHTSKNPQILYRSYRESYTLVKEEYFYFLHKKNLQKQKSYLKKLVKLFSTIYTSHYYQTRESDMMLQEALFLQQPEKAFHLAREKEEKISKEIAEMEQIYYLALKQNNQEYSFKAVDFEVAHDKKNHRKWQEAKYYLLVKYYTHNQIVNYLKPKAKVSHFWQEKLAKYYFSQKEFTNSASIYMQEFSTSRSYKKKKFYFKKTISTLAAGEEMYAIVRVAKEYENYFFHDKSMRKYLLKTYIIYGKPEYAAALSKKILQRIY